MTVTDLADADGELDAALDDCDRWQPAGDLHPDDPIELDCDGGLQIDVDSPDSADFLAEYVANPLVLPVALAGPVPAPEVDHGEFATMGPQRELQRYQRVEGLDVVPRGGVRSMMVDLEYTNLAAQNYTALKDRDEVTLEVWANDSAPADTPDRLKANGLAVTKTEYRAELLERMSRSAPALSLRLYLVAAGLALLLVIGAVLLSSTVGAAVRGYDHAALTLAGLPRRLLRNAAVREHVYWIALPTLAGVGAGLAGLALVLPTVPLVSDEAPELAPVYALRPLLPVLGLGALVLGLAAVVWLAVRIGRRRGAVRRLRDNES